LLVLELSPDLRSRFSDTVISLLEEAYPGFDRGGAEGER
jgi:hypothetical protein